MNDKHQNETLITTGVHVDDIRYDAILVSHLMSILAPYICNQKVVLDAAL